MSDFTDGMKTVATWCGCILLGGYTVNACMSTDWYKESVANDAREASAAAIPRVIREADGCKVYQFHADGRDHYFTRCGATVTTDRTGSESCGKNCARPTSEVITTKGNRP